MTLLLTLVFDKSQNTKIIRWISNIYVKVLTLNHSNIDCLSKKHKQSEVICIAGSPIIILAKH